MAKIEVKFKTSYEEREIDPVTLSDGSVVTMKGVLGGESKKLSGEAVKDGQQVALIRLSPESGRLYIQIQPLSAVSADAVLEIIEAFSAGISAVYK